MMKIILTVLGVTFFGQNVANFIIDVASLFGYNVPFVFATIPALIIIAFISCRIVSLFKRD